MRCLRSATRSRARRARSSARGGGQILRDGPLPRVPEPIALSRGTTASRRMNSARPRRRPDGYVAGIPTSRLHCLRSQTAYSRVGSVLRDGLSVSSAVSPCREDLAAWSWGPAVDDGRAGGRALGHGRVGSGNTPESLRDDPVPCHGATTVVDKKELISRRPRGGPEVHRDDVRSLALTGDRELVT